MNEADITGFSFTRPLQFPRLEKRTGKGITADPHLLLSVVLTTRLRTGRFILLHQQESAPLNCSEIQLSKCSSVIACVIPEKHKLPQHYGMLYTLSA